MNTAEFTNQNTEEARTITKFRNNFYQGGDPPDSGVIGGTTFQVGGPAVETSLGIPAGSTTTYTIDYENSANIQGGDWFIITVQYDTGDTAQYFATIPN